MSFQRHFFIAYATHNGFKYNPQSDPEIEFKRLAAQMRWGSTTFEKKYFECFQRNYQPMEEKPLTSQDYFLHFQNYNGFEHKPENQPLYEFLRLAKHMGWVGPTLKLNKQAFNSAMNNQMFQEKKKEEVIRKVESSKEIVLNKYSEEKKRETANQKIENDKNDTTLNIAQNSNADKRNKTLPMNPFVYPNEETLLKSSSAANNFNIPTEKQISGEIPKIINQNTSMNKKMMRLNPSANSFVIPSALNEEKPKIDKILNKTPHEMMGLNPSAISFVKPSLNEEKVHKFLIPIQNTHQNDRFPNKKIAEKNRKKNPKTPVEFFEHYEKFQKFPFDRKNNYLDEFERMVKYFKWGDVQSTIERDKLLKCIVEFNESKQNDNESQNIKKSETPRNNDKKCEDKLNLEIEKNATISDQNKKDQINVLSDQNKIEQEQNSKIDQEQNSKIDKDQVEQETIDQNPKNLNEMQNLIYEQKNGDESHWANDIKLTTNYFDTYVTHHHFVRVETNDPHEEYERLAKFMNWGKTAKNNHYNNHWPHFLESLRPVVTHPKKIKKDSNFVEKYSKVEKIYELKKEEPSDYFTTYVKYNKFEHFTNNYPLDEYERLAKHMNWEANLYKDQKKKFLQTLTNVKGKWEYKKEAYKSQNNFKKDKHEANLTWKRKIPEKIIYEQKEIKNEKIPKNQHQNQKFLETNLDSKKEPLNEKNKRESNPENKKKKIEAKMLKNQKNEIPPDPIPEIRKELIKTQEKQMEVTLGAPRLKSQENEIPLKKILESKTSQIQQKQNICVNKKHIARIEKNDSDSEEEKKVNINQQYKKPVSDSSSEEKKNCNDTIEFEREFNFDDPKDEEFSFEEDFCYDTYNCEWNRALENEVFSGDDD